MFANTHDDVARCEITVNKVVGVDELQVADLGMAGISILVVDLVV
jgi:hypothetical protein